MWKYWEFFRIPKRLPDCRKSLADSLAVLRALRFANANSISLTSPLKAANSVAPHLPAEAALQRESFLAIHAVYS